MYLPDRVDDVVGGRSFQEIASRSAANRAKHIVVGVVRGEDDDGWNLAGKGRDALATFGAGQLQIEKHDVRVVRGDRPQAVVDAADRADDLEIARALEDRRDPLAHDRVVVNDEDANHRGEAP